MSVWRDQTETRFNTIAAQFPDFLTPAQKLRAERIRQARMLFANQHRQYFLQEGRTQHKFPVIETDGMTIQPYFTVNVLRLVSLKTADLLFGTDPILRVEDDVQQAKLSALAERTGLHPLILKAAISCTHAAEAFLEARVERGQVYIGRISAGEIFPMGEMLAANAFGSYVRYSLRTIPQGEAVRRFLLETTYRAGAILRAAFELDAKGQKVGPVALNATLAGKLIFADALGAAWKPEQPTGIAANTIVYIPNFQDDEDLCPVSSYDGVIDLQDNLNALETQINRILEQHADPIMYADAQSANGQGNLRSRQKVYFKRPGQDPPGYIVRDLQLESAMSKQDRTLNRLCILAEMSPSLLGLTQGAAAESWKKFKLSATNALAMAQRKAAVWRPKLRELLALAQDLENTLPGERYDRGAVAVEMRDGIPEDDLDVANYIATLRGAQAMSDERAVALQIPDTAGQQRELAALGEQRAAATPSVLLGEPAAPETTNEPADGEGGSSAAQAATS